MVGEQTHVGRVAIVRGHVEGRRTDVGQIVPAQRDQRRITGRPAFFVELLLLPLNPRVRVGAMLEQRFRQLERCDLPRRLWNTIRPPAETVAAVGAGLPQPGERVQRRAARVGRVGVRAVIQQHRRDLVVRVHNRHVQRARAILRHVIRVATMTEQRANRVGVAAADGEEERR